MRIAVLSDIHGNSWALDAVLAEAGRASVDRVLNLGDCFFGPLDPGGTYARLLGYDWPTVRGNQDRSLIDGSDNATARFTLDEIGREGVDWLADRTELLVRDGAMLACHGNLAHDDVTLLERVDEPGHVRWATDVELLEDLVGAGAGAQVVLCGHSHRAASVQLSDGRLVVNPGSVGLPAYTADDPHPHAMESGTSHARWAILERTAAGWNVDLRATAYDTAPAVAAARKNGRPDWAAWIETGRASI